MKGVILAGGKGTRLYPATITTNKLLVAVAGIPMIEYPLATLTKMGVTDITIVSGRELESSGSIMHYLGSGKDRGLRFHYEVQDQAGGVAEALSLVKQSVYGHRIAVVLGDNIFEDDFKAYADRSQNQKGCVLFLKQVPDPERFGIAEVVDGHIVSVEEKPKSPKSDLAATGLYLYDASVFDRIEEVINTIGYSQRKELEISDVNNLYVKEGLANYAMIPGFWSDAGKQDSLERVIEYIRLHHEKFRFRSEILERYNNSY